MGRVESRAVILDSTLCMQEMIFSCSCKGGKGILSKFKFVLFIDGGFALLAISFKSMQKSKTINKNL